MPFLVGSLRGFPSRSVCSPDDEKRGLAGDVGGGLAVVVRGLLMARSGPLPRHYCLAGHNVSHSKERSYPSHNFSIESGFVLFIFKIFIKHDFPLSVIKILKKFYVILLSQSNKKG